MILEAPVKLPFDPADIEGYDFFPADDDSYAAIVRFDTGMSCGVSIETSMSQPALRFCPSIQFPECARDGFAHFVFDGDHARDGFARAVSDDDEDDLLDLNLDKIDGELTLINVIDKYDPEGIKAQIDQKMAWFDEYAIPLCLRYIAAQIASSADEG